MGKFIYTQNSFASGEVSPEFFARENASGLSKLENMDVLSGGGLSRRPGLQAVSDKSLDNDTLLVPFSFSETESYLLAISAGHINIFKDGAHIQDLLVPLGVDALPNLQYAQRFGTMILVHPNYQPSVLQKKGELFELSVFDFSANDNMTRNIPFMKFDDAVGIKITVSAAATHGTNFATFTTSKPFWTPENVNNRLMLLNKQWLVVEYKSPTVVIASTNGGYTVPDVPVSDWSEAAFGTRRGWPRSISFHQDRLVFGGSRDWPSGVWMSRVGDHHNFSVGTGLDDEAIFLTLLSEQRQQICTVVSSDNLQILTSAGEWAISNKPLTPSSVNIKQHTSVGSFSNRYLPPQKIEGATIFVARSGSDIRELALDELGENYNAKDLCALSKHLMNAPCDLAYNDQSHQLFVVLKNGDMAVLNKNSMLGISAWGKYKTQGKFKSITVMNGQTFVTVERDGITKIEKFTPKAMIDIDKYGFSYTAQGLPLLSEKHAPKKIRLYKLGARVLDTKSLFINNVRAPLPNEIYGENEPGFSGDVSINLLGTQCDTIKPMWKITGSEPLPATVLSITVEGRYLI